MSPGTREWQYIENKHVEELLYCNNAYTFLDLHTKFME